MEYFVAYLLHNWESFKSMCISFAYKMHCITIFIYCECWHVTSQFIMSHESCSTMRKRHSRPSAAVGVGADLVTLSSTVRDLGIAIDSDVTMQTHVSKTVSAWFAVLWQLRSIRRSVSETLFKSLVVSLVMPCLDYGNTTLAGLPAYQHQRLQSVLNAAARLVHRSSRYDHITPILRDLHWLKTPKHFVFKIGVLVYRCLHDLAPLYLSDYFEHIADTNRRCLRSSSSSLLAGRRTRFSTVGDRAFPVIGSRFWNTLPDFVTYAPSLSIFWSRLKSHLFEGHSRLTVTDTYLQCLHQTVGQSFSSF